MTVYYGVVKDNRVILDDDSQLTDGLPVEVHPRIAQLTSVTPTEETVKERLHAAGLLTRLPTSPPVSTDSTREPITVYGQPLSESIIADRR